MAPGLYQSASASMMPKMGVVCLATRRFAAGKGDHLSTCKEVGEESTLKAGMKKVLFD